MRVNFYSEHINSYNDTYPLNHGVFKGFPCNSTGFDLCSLCLPSKFDSIENLTCYAVKFQELIKLKYHRKFTRTRHKSVQKLLNAELEKVQKIPHLAASESICVDHKKMLTRKLYNYKNFRQPLTMKTTSRFLALIRMEIPFAVKWLLI